MLERSFKVVFLGANAVGKTSLLVRHLSGGFQQEYIPTISTNISEKIYNFSDFSLKLLFWERGDEPASGDELKEFLANTQFFANTQGVAIVYDICRPASLKAAEQHYKTMIKYVRNKPVVWLVGNKVDLKHLRRVDRALAEEKAKELGAGYIETSAKTGENVDTFFNQFLKGLIRARLMEVKRQLEEKTGHG
jgi:small GTP-binding protein